MNSRACPVCGSSLNGRRVDAKTCSPACRALNSRLQRLIAGKPVAGYATIRDLLYGPQRCDGAPEKTPVGPDVSTRTARARLFVLGHCCEVPGHRTTGRYFYGEYQRWAETHEPDKPLSYGALLRVVEDWAPFEQRTTEHPPGRAGRPTIVFVGIWVRAVTRSDDVEAA